MHPLPLLTLLVASCCLGITRAAVQQGDFNVADPPYDTPVQNLLAPVLAIGIGPSGGPAYLGGVPAAPAVCAAADDLALVAPVPVTTVDGLFYNVSGIDARLDATHACYLDTTRRPPRCAAPLASLAADCGGKAADAVGPLLSAPSAEEVEKSSAAVLAAYLRGGAAQRLKLERSLRRTREVVVALSHARELVLAANGTITDAREMAQIRGKATQYVRALVSAAYDRVMEKYYVLDMCTNESLGVTAAFVSAVAGPAPRPCDVYNYAHRLLWGTEASSTVLLALMQSTLAIADGIHSKTYAPAARGVQCAQLLTSLGVMALEDDAVRQVAAMSAVNALNASSVWALSDFELLAPNRTTALRQRQLWSLAYVFAALSDPVVVVELVGSAAVAECMRRAALVVPDPATGSVPPSIYWCLDNASTSEMAQGAVARRSLAVRESETSANGRCLWGFSEWDGGCAGDAFDPNRCASCPHGSVGDGEGHCVCGNGTATYATLTGGCLSKGAAHDVAGVRVLQESGIVSVSANASVSLFSVQLPQAAALADPSAYLRVNVSCVDGGRGGGTRLLATPAGDRAAACASVVAYERHAERSGERDTFRGAQYFVTYAENLTIAVLGTAAFFGETCRLEVGVQSALRQASRSVVAGTWTFTPRAESFTLLAHSYVGNVAPEAAVAPTDVPLCGRGSASVAAGVSDSSPLAVVQVGVCRTSSGGPAVFVLPETYTAFGLSTQLTVGRRILNSAGAARDASFAEALRSLAAHTSFAMTVEGRTSSDVLWSAVWQLNETPLAVNAWSGGWVVPLPSSLLSNVRTLRLRVTDPMNTSAFAASAAWVELRYGNGAINSDSSSSSSSSINGKDNDGSPTTGAVHYNFWYVILIAVVSVLDAVVFVALVLLIFLRFAAYDVWPQWCR